MNATGPYWWSVNIGSGNGLVSHYLIQCWFGSLSPYGVTRPQWVNWQHNTSRKHMMVFMLVADIMRTFVPKQVSKTGISNYIPQFTVGSKINHCDCFFSSTIINVTLYIQPVFCVLFQIMWVRSGKRQHREACQSQDQKLTHLPLNKMDAISQMTFSNAFSWMNKVPFWRKFHRSLFLRVHLTKTQHWFRWWLGTE